MKNVKKVVSFIIACMLFFIIPSTFYADTAQQPAVFGQYAVSIDAKTGDVLYDKEAHQKAYPASMTKVLTGIVFLEHTKPGEQIAFSKNALDQEKSNYQIEFQVGETVDRDTALMILMVLSANDMAYAISEHVAGSTEAFAKMMNEKAKELGAQGSNFITPNGLHDPNHYTTPYDMAMITRGALHHPELMKAMITQRTSVTTSRQTVSIFNKARFFENPNCIGGKTGFTNEARNTLVEINQQNGNEIINVVMASQKAEIYNDMKNISDYVFPQFAKQNVLDKATWTKDLSFLDKSVPVELEKNADAVVKQGEGKNVQALVQPLHFENKKLYQEGIHKGEVLGEVDLMKNGNKIDSVKLLSKEDVSFAEPKPKKVSTLPMVLAVTALMLISVIGVLIKKRKSRVK
ncbi:D-alanyl-D-alanine carboxypeptidase family protein [Microbacteriaceae bacterium 4G12]